MQLPDSIRREVGEEAELDRVELGGDDALYVSPTRTLRYRADGLLSDESVEAIPHDAERIVADVGRRTAALTFAYGLDGERSLTLPAERFDDALGPVLDGVLGAAGVTDPEESVVAAFRFSDLTLAVTDARLVKHVGEAVWDEGCESFRFDDVSDLAFEEGDVATAAVLTVDGRRERIKAPNGSARALRERLEGALCAHRADDAPTEGDDAAPGASPTTGGGGGVGGGEGDPSDRSGADGERADVAKEVATLRAAVERQNERLRRQEELIEQLVGELRRGR